MPELPVVYTDRGPALIETMTVDQLDDLRQPTAVRLSNLKVELETLEANAAVAAIEEQQAPPSHKHIYALTVQMAHDAVEEIEQRIRELEP